MQQSGNVTVGHIAKWCANGVICDGGSSGGGGGGTPGGGTGQIQYNNGGSFGGFTAGGDCTIVAATGIVTCTKTNGVNFGYFATGTDAANLTGLVAMANGGTGAALTASNGGIVYTNATVMAILAGTLTANQPLLSGASSAPSWATISYPTSATSGGIPYFNTTSSMATSGLLTANAPVLGGGAGSAPTVGSRSGNTTVFGTVSGSLTSGDCLKADASGNIVDNGSTCGRTALTGNLTLHVNLLGSNDACTGTGTSACNTLAKAITALGSYDLGAFSATISVDDAGPYLGVTLKSYVGAGPVTISTSSNTVICGALTIGVCNTSGGGVSGFSATNIPTKYIIDGFTLQNVGHGILANASNIAYQNITFGAVAPGGFYHVYAQNNAFVQGNSGNKITGGAFAHWYSFANAVITSNTGNGATSLTLQNGDLFPVSATASAAGAGYAASSLLGPFTVSGGTCTVQPYIFIYTTAGGALDTSTNLPFVQGGACSVIPTNPFSVPGGSGSVNITYSKALPFLTTLPVQGQFARAEMGGGIYSNAPMTPATGQTVTVSNATPAVVTWTGFGTDTIIVGDAIQFTTTGALPTPLTPNTTYYVSGITGADTFKVAATLGGADINTGSAGSGTHRAFAARGAKFFENLGGWINTTGGGVNFYPGNSAPCTAPGSAGCLLYN